MSIHTPGPWRVTNMPDLCAPEISNSSTPIAMVRQSGETWAGNALLIAAAPDLLQLAYRVAEHFKDTDAPLGAAARAAIAKAERAMSGRINLRRQLELIEVRYIKAAIEATGGNKLKAAKLLTISRSCLYRRLELLGLKPMVRGRDELHVRSGTSAIVQ